MQQGMSTECQGRGADQAGAKQYGSAPPVGGSAVPTPSPPAGSCQETALPCWEMRKREVVRDKRD